MYVICTTTLVVLQYINYVIHHSYVYTVAPLLHHYVLVAQPHSMDLYMYLLLLSNAENLG